MSERNFRFVPTTDLATLTEEVNQASADGFEIAHVSDSFVMLVQVDPDEMKNKLIEMMGQGLIGGGHNAQLEGETPNILGGPGFEV